MASPLVAVGGYGRGQLYPHSDVDVMLLLHGEPTAGVGERIEQFLLTLWDIGPRGRARRAHVDDCMREMAGGRRRSARACSSTA